MDKIPGRMGDLVDGIFLGPHRIMATDAFAPLLRSALRGGRHLALSPSSQRRFSR